MMEGEEEGGSSSQGPWRDQSAGTSLRDDTPCFGLIKVFPKSKGTDYSDHLQS